MIFSVFNFTTSSYPEREVALGSLVPDKDLPNNGAIGSAALNEGAEYSKKPDANFNRDIEQNSKITFHAIISRVFSASSRKAVLSAEQANVYQLRHPKEHLRKLCQQKEVQAWLSDRYARGLPCYFINGYRTLVDAALWEQGERCTQTSDPLGSNGEGNASPQTMFRNGYTSAREFPGEHIFAIEYRRVQIAAIKDIDRPQLAPGVWECCTNKGTDWIEAVISDDDEVDASGNGFTCTKFRENSRSATPIPAF